MYSKFTILQMNQYSIIDQQNNFVFNALSIVSCSVFLTLSKSSYCMCAGSYLNKGVDSVSKLAILFDSPSISIISEHLSTVVTLILSSCLTTPDTPLSQATGMSLH